MSGKRFRHRDEDWDAGEERGFRKSRVFYSILTALYLAVVAGATLYGIAIKPNLLPRVETVERGEISAAVPMACIAETADGMQVVNLLQEEQGPWGMRYFVNQIPVTETMEIDEERMFIPDVIGIEGSFISSSTVEFLENGMEVRPAQILPAVG